MNFLVPRIDTFWATASLLIAVLAGYVMFDFARRGRYPDRRVGKSMLAVASLAMGTGIWSMHFVGMLAYSPPIPLGYTATMTGLSWLASVSACFIALRIVAGAPTLCRVAAGALAMGAGISAMHYAGIAALVMTPAIVWDWLLVGGSVVIAVAASAAALLMFFWLRTRTRHSFLCHLLAATAMGLATSGMHYTGMLAAGFPEGSVCLSADALGGNGLAGIALLASAALLLMTLMLSSLDSRMQLRIAAFVESLTAADGRLKTANATLRQHSRRDVLTGLPNRQRFEHRLRRAVARADTAAGGESGRPLRSLAVMCVDLDRFRTINEAFGHDAGDELLRDAGRRLAGALRRRDTVARVGGDSFLLLMEDVADQCAAVALAERLVEVLERPFELMGRHASISASIGIAIYPDHGNADDLVAHADAAMYIAKRAGGSTAIVYAPDMESSTLEAMELHTDLRLAIERGELSLHYQPKLSGEGGQLCGVEALLRWNHPLRGMVSPASFIPIAEQFGLIVPLGNWVIDEACRQMQSWSELGLRLHVAVNISAHQLRRSDFVERIERALRRHHVEPSSLLCEITESVAMDDIKGTQRAFEGLQRMGVYLSIDDFGTGYSSLAYLRQLPARQLKIDRSFVSDIESSADARAIVDAVIHMAHSLGLSVVAEGVETSAQRDALLRLGCDELQGYFFARPMPADALLQWIFGRGLSAAPCDASRAAQMAVAS